MRFKHVQSKVGDVSGRPGNGWSSRRESRTVEGLLARQLQLVPMWVSQCPSLLSLPPSASSRWKVSTERGQSSLIQGSLVVQVGRGYLERTSVPSTVKPRKVPRRLSTLQSRRKATALRLAYPWNSRSGCANSSPVTKSKSKMFHPVESTLEWPKDVHG